MKIAKDLSRNVVRKIGLLITKASDLGMDVGGYGMADENKNSGYVYIWLEDYSFTLYIGPSGDDEIYALWTDPEDGEEHEIEVKGKSLNDLYDWVESLEPGDEE